MAILYEAADDVTGAFAVVATTTWDWGGDRNPSGSDRFQLWENLLKYLAAQ